MTVTCEWKKTNWARVRMASCRQRIRVDRNNPWHLNASIAKNKASKSQRPPKQQLTKCLPFLGGGIDDGVVIYRTRHGLLLTTCPSPPGNQRFLVKFERNAFPWTQTSSFRDAPRLRCVQPTSVESFYRSIEVILSYCKLEFDRFPPFDVIIPRSALVA